MDGQVNQTGGSQDSGYLQGELGPVLPRVLATVAELRPQDPIITLARLLYRFRELNPLPRTKTTVATHFDLSDDTQTCGPTDDVETSEKSPTYYRSAEDTETAQKTALYSTSKASSLKTVHRQTALYNSNQPGSLQTVNIQRAPNATHQPRSLRILHRDDGQDFIEEDSGYFNDLSSTNLEVHREVLPVCSSFGDLFDDDDVG